MYVQAEGSSIVYCRSTGVPIYDLNLREPLRSCGECSYCKEWFSAEQLVLFGIPAKWPIVYEGEGIVCSECDEYLEREDPDVL